MARYRMDDGTIVDTENASKVWQEATDWDGHNRISRNTKSQWDHQTLYRSRKGRYYVEHDSAYRQGKSHIEWISTQEAARWLMLNDEELPDDLKQHQEEISE